LAHLDWLPLKSKRNLRGAFVDEELYNSFATIAK
jgi:hypothetical protein